jgi:hypothetical protein
MGRRRMELLKMRRPFPGELHAGNVEAPSLTEFVRLARKHGSTVTLAQMREWSKEANQIVPRERWLSMANRDKKFSGNGLGAGGNVWPSRVKFGTPTGKVKQDAARKKATDRGPVDNVRPIFAPPAWMSDRSLLPKRPPGKA